MTVLAIMKKFEDRVFDVISFDGNEVMIREQAEKSKPKTLSRKSFIKGYKVTEGALEDILSEPTPIDGGNSEREAGNSPIKSVSMVKSEGRDHRNVTVEFIDPNTDIEPLDAADFISDLVNNHNVIHGDRVIIEQGAMGHVDLNGEQPSFSMHNPIILDTTAADIDDDSITLIYQASGRKVTMTRGEFYAKTIVVGRTRPENDDDNGALPDSFNEIEAPAVTNTLGWSTMPVLPQVDLTATPNETLMEMPPITSIEEQGIVLVPVPWESLVEVAQEEAQNSMKASRDQKANDAKPFIPEPFFLRQSMISSYLQCPDKMYDTYESGYREESIFTRVGTAIHGLMEDFYNDRTIDIDATFDKWWASNSTPEFDWYADWKVFIKRYFEKEAKYEQPNVIVTELEYRTTVNGIPSSGTIDRIDRVDEQTIRIVDYKTNFMAFSDGELQESIQFMKYVSDISTPEVRQMLRDKGDTGEFSIVICTYEMLRLGYRQTVVFEPEQLKVFQDWMKTIWTMILSGTNRAPKLNQYCGFCQKRARCDLYKEQLTAPISSIITENTNIEDVVTERELLTINAKLIKNRLSEIEEQMLAKIAENKGSMEINGYEWNTKSGTRNTYHSSDVFRILAMNGLGDMVPELAGTISKTALDKALKDKKEILAMIEEKKQTSYTKASLNKKKIKPVKPAKE